MSKFSGSSTKKISPANAYTLKLVWSGEQDITSNRSTITVSGTISRNGSTYTAKNLNSGSVNNVSIDEVNYYPTTKYNLIDYTTKEIFSYTQEIEHDTDGKKTIEVDWTFDGNIDANFNPNGTISTSIVLPTIHRASSILVSDGVFGGELTINIDSKNERFTHDLSYSFCDLSGEIAQGVSGECVFNVPLDWMYQIPNDIASRECVITCTTKYNGTIIGTSTCSNFLLSVPVIVVPEIVSVHVIQEEVIEEVIGFVQNKSSGSISIDSRGMYGSTIKTIAVSLNGKELEDISTTGILTESGTNSLSVKVVDSRNRVAETNYNFDVMKYDKPLISSFSVNRCILSGEKYVENDEEGTYAKVEMIGRATTDIYNNSLVHLVLRYKKENESNWKEETLNYADSLIVYLSDLDADASYDFEVVLSDVFESVVKKFELASTHMILDIHESGRGLAVGKSSEKENTFEVGYPLDMNNHEIYNAKIVGLVDLLYPIGSIYMCVNEVSPAILFGGTWEQIKDVFLLASGDIYEMGIQGGSANISLMEKHLPAHKHQVGTLKTDKVSLTGRATYRDVNTSDSNLILSANGIFKYSKSSWSGSHWAMSGVSANGYYYQHLDIDASHEHALSGETENVGNGIAFEIMPPFVTVNMWKRIA